MRVLVACEFSGVVRDAFRSRGHDAWSCDLLATEQGLSHIQADVTTVLGWGWDLMIAHPPCTHLAVSGARWFKGREAEQEQALAFVQALLNAPIQRIALENPISVISSRIRKPDQIIQPWQFGHGEVKATCFWLKNLPPLIATGVVEGRVARVHHASPGPESLEGAQSVPAGDCGGNGRTVGRQRMEARSMIDLTTVTDAQIDAAIDNTLADLALAEKYEHNAHLRPAIRQWLDKLNGEKGRRSLAMLAPTKGGQE